MKWAYLQVFKITEKDSIIFNSCSYGNLCSYEQDVTCSDYDEWRSFLDFLSFPESSSVEEPEVEEPEVEEIVNWRRDGF